MYVYRRCADTVTAKIGVAYNLLAAAYSHEDAVSQWPTGLSPKYNIDPLFPDGLICEYFASMTRGRMRAFSDAETCSTWGINHFA